MPNTEIRLPDPDGRELTLAEHVVQSTLIHNEWNELDHMEYLIQEVGFDGEYCRENIGVIMNAMLETRAELVRNMDPGCTPTTSE